MEFTSFVRRPFMVDAVEVTAENIAEVAELVGTLKTEGDKQYIQVDRRLVPNVYKVYPGFWMTKMGDNVRCYSSHIFETQFLKASPENADFVDALLAQQKTKATS